MAQSEHSIIDYHNDLANQIDLRREVLQRELKERSEKLLREVSNHKNKCLEDLAIIKSRETENEKKLNEIIDLYREKLNKLEMNENLWEQVGLESLSLQQNVLTMIDILNSEILAFEKITFQPISFSFGDIVNMIQTKVKYLSLTCFDV